MVLIALSVVEQRLDVVRAVLAGAGVSEVAEQAGVSRQSVHAWVVRYLSEGVPGLVDRSSRPHSCPHQVSEVIEAAVAELRREHPRWGATRIRLELLRKGRPWIEIAEDQVPSVSTINRILRRQGLVRSKPRKRSRDSYVRFERPGPMQLWGIDIVGGIQLVNTATGVIREAKIVTGIDDHSRFCVMAAVVERATARAVCLAFAQALAKYGVPEEVLTDNGKQFTDRFSRYGPSRGEVLFDKICRRNGIAHRLTQPASPNQNGKVERFHGTLRPDFLDEAGLFESIEAAQAAVDVWVGEYNAERPHQALDAKVPIVPADRFKPAVATGVELWVPGALAPSEPATGPPETPAEPSLTGRRARSGEPVELERPVPPSGNMMLGRQQLWLGPARAGQMVRFWVSCDWVHLSIGGTRVKTVRSQLSVPDLDKLAALGAVAAGPSPMGGTNNPDGDPEVVEVERTVARAGTVSLAGRVLTAAEILAGQRVGIRIETNTLMFFDLETRELLRTRPNPLPPGAVRGLRSTRPVGPVPRPSSEPITVQRKPSNTGVISITGQKVALGRQWARQIVTIHVAHETLAAELPDGETRIVRRTTDQPVRSFKAQRPRIASLAMNPAEEPDAR